MTDKEKKIMIPLLEKLMNECCINFNKENGICTDYRIDKTCPFYIEPYDWCDGWDCAIGRVTTYLENKG